LNTVLQVQRPLLTNCTAQRAYKVDHTIH